MNGPVLSRRALLTAAAAGLVSTACANDPPERLVGKDATIFDLSFTEKHRYRPFHVVAPGFVQDSRPAVGETGDLVRGDASPQAPFAAVEVDVGRAAGVVVAGLSTADGDRVVATYSAAGGTVSIEVRAGGTTTIVRRRRVKCCVSSTV